MRTHQSCTRQGGPVLRPAISPWKPCSPHLNTDPIRRSTHLSASSGPRPLSGCGTPTARRRPQGEQMCLITANLSSFVRLCQGLSSHQVNRPWCCSSLSAPGPAHCHACPPSDTQRLPLMQLREASIWAVLLGVVYKAYCSPGGFLLLSPETFSLRGRVQPGQSMWHQTGATCCSYGGQSANCEMWHIITTRLLFSANGLYIADKDLTFKIYRKWK